MSLNTRRLYLNSVDTDIKYDVDGKVSWDLSKAGIHCKNDQMIAVSLVRAELPSVLGVASMNDAEISNDRNLLLQLTDNTATTKTLIFNIQIPTASPHIFPLTLQTTINDMVAYINESFGSVIIKIADGPEQLGIYRLMCENVGQSLSFNKDHSSPELLRALGVRTDSNTVISSSITSPYNWDLSQVCPSVRLITNLNFNSESTNTSGDSNILDSVATATTFGNQYFQINTIVLSNGEPLYIKNKSMVLHENSYMSRQVIPNKYLNQLSIELATKDNKPITVNQQPFLLVIQIDILDNL